MEERSQGAPDGEHVPSTKGAVYRLKVELRREERADRGDDPYAHALRRVIRAFSEHTAEDALILLEDEMLDLEHRDDAESAEVEALRRALSLAEPRPKGNRELYRYYLRKMEHDGRGDEPFARALRRALESPNATSMDELFIWRDLSDKPE